MRRILLTSLLAATLPLTACAARQVPVTVKEPGCTIAPFPLPADDLGFEACNSPDNPAGINPQVCMSVRSVAELAAWLQAVESWRESVQECPGIKLVLPGPPAPKHSPVPTVEQVMTRR